MKYTYTYNYIVRILLFACAFFIPTICFAVITVSEIMYDPPGGDTNHEWIELENDGDTAVDISGWKLFEGTSNHSLTSISGDTTIPAHGFAIIADNATTFQSDWPAFSGVLFDSVFSLANTGETFSLKDSSGVVIDEVTYSSESGANGDGKTLFGSASVWVAGNASPGAADTPSDENPDTTDENDDTNPDQNNDQENTTTQNSSNAPSTSTSKVKAQKAITAKITLPSGTILYDATSILSASVIGISGSPMDRGRLVWNFGDGDSFSSTNLAHVDHVYSYPGRYVVQVEYYEYSYDTEPKAIDRATISVVAPKIEFSDNGLTFSLKNQGKTEIDISGWRIESSAHSFSFAKGTYLLANGFIILEKQKLGFPYTANYQLLYPNTLPVPLLLPEIDVVTIEKKVAVTKEEKKTEIAEGDLTMNVESLENIVAVDNTIAEIPTETPSEVVVVEPQAIQEKTTKKILSPRVILLLVGIVAMGAFVSLLFSRGGDTPEEDGDQNKNEAVDGFVDEENERK